MARGFRGVKDDLSEIGRHLLDVACFLSPLIAASATYTDSPPSSPHGESRNPSPYLSNQSHQQQQQSRVIAGALNDLAEFGGGLRSGIVRLSSALKRTVAISGGGGNVGMREELLRFVRDLVKCPESWLEFPVPVGDHFDMSRHQRDHITTVELLAPSLATVRISLCPSFMSEESFWKIYFALLHPRLNKLESEFLTTQKIVEEMRMNLKKEMQDRLNPEPQHAVAGSSSSMLSDKEINSQHDSMYEQTRANYESHNLTAESSSSMTSEMSGDAQQDANQSQVRQMRTEATTRQYFDRWFVTPGLVREMDSSTATREQIRSKEDDSCSEAEDDGNMVLLKKYGTSHSVEDADQDYSLVSYNEHLRLSKKAYSGDHDEPLPKLSGKGSTDDDTSDWHAVEDSSDYEIVDRS